MDLYKFSGRFCSSITMDFLDELNSVQRSAVTCMDGPSLIVAGAGSGKTRVLTYKIAYLLQQGVPASSIMALTFTNKAAREMKERIRGLVVSGLEDNNAFRYLMMGTFHSVCGKLLRAEAEKLGYTKDFTIYDTIDSKSLIKTICKELELDDKIYNPGFVLYKISNLKNSFVSPEAYGANSNLQREDRALRMYQFYDVYHLYQLRLKESNAMDFDDMILETLRLLREFSEVRNKIQQKFRYILVDEYQDTNHVQYLLVKELAAPQNNITVVGDDAQSIYSFRGADIRNILDFNQTYPTTKVFKLERNYRSTQNIVKASNSLIHYNDDQIHKELYSEKEDGSQLILKPYLSDRGEAKGVVAQITQDHLKLHTPYNKIAVLYRTNAQSRLFEDELRNNSIPYRIYGSISFYQRREIKDIISYLRLAVNPLDNEALVRAISIYSGIGNTTLKKIAACAQEHKTAYMTVAQNPAMYGITGDATISKLQIFASKIADLAKSCNDLGAFEVVVKALSIAGVSLDIENAFDKDEVDRKQNIQSFLQLIQEYEEKKQNEEGIEIVPINEFLYEVSLLTDQDDQRNDISERVTLMTIHSAKGLEFPTVFITGLENGLFPSKHNMEDRKELEEERRLFYVAITRAMERCYLCYAKQRFVNGEFRTMERSMLLNNIDKHYIKTSNAFESLTEFANTRWSFSIPSKAAFSWEEPSQAPVRSTSPVSGSTSSIASPAWKSGDRVSHRVFGEGTVVRVYRDEVTENDKIEINFDTQGTKTLLLTHAKLERI